MTYKSVDAGRGIEWLKDGVALVLKNPGVFLVIALIISLIGVIPLVNLAMLILGPALFGGFLYAMREQDRGAGAEIGQLFTAFQQPGKIGPMIVLCLPGIAAAIVMGILAFLFIGSLLASVGLAASQNSAAGLGAGFGFGALVFLLLGFAVAVAVYAILIFAVPRVMFDNIEPFAAMKESLAASLANIVPLLLLVLIVFVVCVVAGAILMFIPILGPLLLGLAVSSVMTAATYVAYKDVFGAGESTLPPVPPAA